MSRCRVCGRVDDAFALLDGIAFRGKLAYDEKLLAWRAIKTLYRFVVDRETCQWIVGKIRRIDSKAAFGPRAAYYLSLARNRVEQMRSDEFAAPRKPRQSGS